MPMGMVHRARRNLIQIQEDLFSETCRRNSFCLTCNHAFCSHCCFYHHVHSLGVNTVVKIDLDARGLPVLPTHTDEGHRIMQCMVEEMTTEDFTSRLPRDAFCLHCGEAFCADVCSHHEHRGRGLPDGAVVIRVEERGGRRCVRCTGTEWWASHMDEALGDPVHVGEDDQGRYYELLPVLRAKPGTCMRCGVGLLWHLATHCSDHCAQTHLRETDERRHRREARQAALALRNN